MGKLQGVVGRGPARIIMYIRIQSGRDRVFSYVREVADRNAFSIYKH